MTDRRDFIGYIGTGAIGGIVGYYVGAQELLGIQSEEVVRSSSDDTPTEDTPTEDTPTEDTPTEDTPTEDTPTEDTPTEDTPTEDTPTEDTPTEDTPTEDTGEGGSGLVTSGFPRSQYDNQNTGSPSAINGPRGSPTRRWQFGTDGNNHTTPAIHDGVAYFGGEGVRTIRTNMFMP
ncbi:hypothetical protein [Halovenus salina]|uniref:Uncharacterized protein n=1 Tax=Halovenus salina TaxID=1510225 RepID=A0ABD5W0S8_9EURY